MSIQNIPHLSRKANIGAENPSKDIPDFPTMIYKSHIYNELYLSKTSDLKRLKKEIVLLPTNEGLVQVCLDRRVK